MLNTTDHLAALSHRGPLAERWERFPDLMHREACREIEIVRASRRAFAACYWLVFLLGVGAGLGIGFTSRDRYAERIRQEAREALPASQTTPAVPSTDPIHRRDM